MEKTISYEWVLARFNSTDERGKKAVELANSGTGYYIINKDRSKGEDVIVAFKWIPIDKDGNSRPLPVHLELASERQVCKLDEWDKKRSGIPDGISKTGSVSRERVDGIMDFMRK